jgi:hypothetical protein
VYFLSPYCELGSFLSNVDIVLNTIDKNSWLGGLAQMVEHLPSKPGALYSTLVLKKKEKKRKPSARELKFSIESDISQD